MECWRSTCRILPNVRQEVGGNNCERSRAHGTYRQAQSQFPTVL